MTVQDAIHARGMGVDPEREIPVADSAIRRQMAGEIEQLRTQSRTWQLATEHAKADISRMLLRNAELTNQVAKYKPRVRYLTDACVLLGVAVAVLAWLLWRGHGAS